MQIQDEFSYDLVYSGINLLAGYQFTRLSERNLLVFNPEIGFGGIFNKGAGFAWEFKPVDIYYGYKARSDYFTAGAYITSNYHWQQYPELQGCRLFWFSSIELGPKVIFHLPYKSGFIKIVFSNSLAGFTSRPESQTETYFYSFDFSEFISTSHRNLTFGSYNLFNHTNFEIEIENNRWNRISFGYEFEYFGYYRDPGFSYLNHSLNVKLLIGKQ
ncbi:hypothetical protein ACFLT1_06220 [Bacteroidota bacterium]